MIKIAFYDTRSYDKDSFCSENEKFGFEIDYFDFKLTEKTAFTAKNFDAVCVFVRKKRRRRNRKENISQAKNDTKQQNICPRHTNISQKRKPARFLSDCGESFCFSSCAFHGTIQP